MEGGVTLHPSSSPGGGPTEEDETGANAVWFPAMGLSEQREMILPIANISRIMKRVLPANAKIRKEAKESVQECATEFIGFITSEANDKCLRDKRKTINGDDIIWAMTTLGFDNYVEPLTVYFQRFKEMEGDPKASGGSPSGPEALSRSPNRGRPSSPDIQCRKNGSF